MKPIQPAGRAWLPLILCLLLALVAMGGVCVNDFTSWDDPHTLAFNPWIIDPSIQSLIHYWQQPAMDLYIPVTYSLWVVVAAVGRWFADAPLSGPNPHLFHALNLLVHLVCAGLVFALLLELFEKPWTAFVGAVVFAIHPVQVEAVAWASGLKDVLAATLSMVSILLVVRQLKQSTKPLMKSPRYWLALPAYAAALLAKPSAVVTPLVLVILARWALKISWRRVFIAIWPWAVLAIPCIIWTKLAQPAVVVAASSPVWARPLVAGDALGFYLIKLFWPVWLCVDYGRTPAWVLSQGWKEGQWGIPILVVIVLWLVRKRFAWGLVGAAIFLASLLPVLGLVRFDFQHYSTTADHYLYLPMLGVAIGVCGVTRLRGWLWPMVAAIVLMMLLSMAQVRHWRETPALFTRVLAVNPRSWAAHNSLSAWLLQQGDIDKAQHEAQLAVNINPDSAPSWVNLGAAMALKNDLSGARIAYQRAIEVNPSDAVPHAAMGGLLGQLGQLAEARRHCLLAIELDGEQPTAWLNLGTIDAAEEKWPDARKHLARAVELAPRDVRARTNYAIALILTGEPSMAESQLQLALSIDPAFPPARQTLQQLHTPSR
ncbi:MAG: tetratricopeptide repeat protein [Phycisphaerales bacterium]|nr:tetratricopeptide repeat protein [Phycisphaerales bacterium]